MHVGSITLMEDLMENINRLEGGCGTRIPNKMVPFIRSYFTFSFLSHLVGASSKIILCDASICCIVTIAVTMTPTSSDILVELSMVLVPEKIKIIFFIIQKKVMQFSIAKLHNLEF